MKRIYFILMIAVAVLLGSCTKDFEDFNNDPKHPTEVSGETLFSNAQKALADQVASSNVNRNVWKLWAQYWTETTYTDEANYNIVNRRIADNTFSTFYRSVLNNLNEAQNIISTSDAIGDAAKVSQANKMAIIDLLKAYSYQRLVDIFGNVPYTDALKISETLSPKYDDAAGIYADLINNVDAAVNALDETGSSFGGADLYYNGDVAAWKKFGNSLKLKMGLYLADVNAAMSKSTVEAAAAAGVISTPAENCQMVYLGESPNTNPIYADLVLSGRKDFIPANTVVDMMAGLSDPRMDDYFTPMADGTYSGGIYGIGSPYSDYSHVAPAILDPTYPSVLIDDVEMKFYMAEAAARGYSVGGDAESMYNDAVTSSIVNWGGTTAEADAYLLQPAVAFDAADWKNVIGTQAWIAFYVRGFVGYTSWRRLDAPTFNTSPDAQTDGGAIPVRFTYPIKEQTLNKTNYTDASAAIGGDDLLTRLFWDVQ